MILSTLTIWFLQIFHTQCEVIVDPSLKPAVPFSADEDAEAIRKQMTKNFVTRDRDEISNIFFHKTYDQRHKIEKSYNQKFCQDEDAKKCPLRSAFKDISIIALERLYTDALLSPQKILASLVHNSIESGKGEVGAIEEVICANDKEMKNKMNEIYMACFLTSIEDHLKMFNNDDNVYQNVMLNYCWKGLPQENKITSQDVNKESQALRKIDYKKDKGGFQAKLIELLNKYSEPDLKQIFKKYRNDKNGIDDAVNEAFEVEKVRRAYKTLVRYVEDTSKYYADELYDTVDNSFTLLYQIDKNNRIILTRCERDLLRILNKYEEIHDGESFTKHLKSWIMGEPARISIRGKHSISLWKSVNGALLMKHI